MILCVYRSGSARICRSSGVFLPDPASDQDHEKLSAVVSVAILVQYGANAWESASRSRPSPAQVSVLMVAVPLSKVRTGVEAGSAPFKRMSAIMSAVSRPRFA